MPQKFYKHKLLLDEGFHLRSRLPILNHRFDIKHITGDFKQTGVSTNLAPEQIDKKLTALLAKSGPKTLYGKLTTISGETK